MDEAKSSVSHAQTYQELGEYWDEHDLGDIWEDTEHAEFVISGHARTIYYAVESALSQKLQEVAQRRGVSTETLVNQWLRERLTQEAV